MTLHEDWALAVGVVRIHILGAKSGSDLLLDGVSGVNVVSVSQLHIDVVVVNLNTVGVDIVVMMVTVSVMIMFVIMMMMVVAVSFTSWLDVESV